MSQTICVTYRGVEYQWNGKSFFDKRTYLTPPTAFVPVLKSLLEKAEKQTVDRYKGHWHDETDI